MNKIILRTFLIFILIISVINIKDIYAGSLGDVISNGKNFIESSNGNFVLEKDKLKDTSDSIYKVLLMISFVVVAVVGISLGIKFMMSGVEEKADVKNSLIVFVIGCIVIYGSFGIWRVLVNFLNTL